MKDPTVGEKFDVMMEDISSAAKLAVELKQNCLAAVLYEQMAVLLYARSKKGNIDTALKMMREMADACIAIGQT